MITVLFFKLESLKIKIQSISENEGIPQKVFEEALMEITYGLAQKIWD
jgi:hypothetical protein